MMRNVQLVLGLAIIIAGILVLLVVNGWIAPTLSDLAAVALVLSGVLFAVPGFIWRRDLPWLSSLFIPAMLAFAAGVILLYTNRVGIGQGWYSLMLFPVAVGAAFLAMFYLGPHASWLWTAGVLVGGIGLFCLAVFLCLFSTITALRILGSLLLVGVGLGVVFDSILSRRTRRGAVANRQPPVISRQTPDASNQ